VKGDTRLWNPTTAGARARHCLLRSWRRWIRRIEGRIMTSTILMRGARLEMENVDGLDRMETEEGSRKIGKRSANEGGRSGDGGGGKRRRLLHRLRKEMA
jgi:hypothetical protein